MNTGIVTDYNNSLHRYRGIGTYTNILIASLKKYDTVNSYTEIAQNEKIKSSIQILHYPFFDFFKRTLKVYKNIKTVVTIHDIIPIKFSEHFPSGMQGTINFWLQKKQLRMVDAIITDSQCSKSDIHSILGISDNIIHVVGIAYGGNDKLVTRDAAFPLRLNTGLTVSYPFLLYVGDINWNKNIIGLIRAFSKLKSQHRALNKLHLLLVGKAFTGPNIPELVEIQKAVKTSGYAEDIIYAGFVSQDELYSLYRAASVYVQPSWYEGFGLPVLDALGRGTLVVSSNASSLPEVGGDAVLYFDPARIEDMVRCLFTALTLPKTKREHLIKAGMKQAGFFTMKRMAQDTIRVYQSVLDIP